MLPHGPTGFNWNRAGTRYLQGWAAQSLCPHTKAEAAVETACTAVYDLASGAVSDRSGSGVPDLDRAGAPPICLRLREAIFRATQAGFGRLFSYGDELFAHQGSRSGAAEIDRCHGRSSVMHVHGTAVDFDVRGPMVTWDTGHSAMYEFQEPGTRHGELTSYQFSDGGRRTWSLPSVSLRHGSVSENGVFGYSSHTTNTVFWIAARTLGCEKVACVETYSVFAAPVR